MADPSRTASDDEVRSLASRLADACRDAGHPIMVDGCVRTAAAALLIGRSERTLEAWRAARDPRLPWRSGVGVVRYSLEDIARALLARDEVAD